MNNKIVITTDGKETIARLYDGKKVIKSATAKCSPDDTFDFNIGAKLAFERLIGANESEWKVVNRNPKVGDYIQLTSKIYSFNCCGDILKVDEASKNCVGVIGKNHPRDTGDSKFVWHYTNDMFNVIERVGEKKVEEPKYYNGKVVCVKSNYYFWSAGKVYEFKDGNITDDDGDSRSLKCTCFEDVSKWARTISLGNLKFIPYVE